MSSESSVPDISSAVNRLRDSLSFFRTELVNFGHARRKAALTRREYLRVAPQAYLSNHTLKRGICASGALVVGVPATDRSGSFLSGAAVPPLPAIPTALSVTSLSNAPACSVGISCVGPPAVPLVSTGGACSANLKKLGGEEALRMLVVNSMADRSLANGSKLALSADDVQQVWVDELHEEEGTARISALYRYPTDRAVVDIRQFRLARAEEGAWGVQRMLEPNANLGLEADELEQTMASPVEAVLGSSRKTCGVRFNCESPVSPQRSPSACGPIEVHIVGAKGLPDVPGGSMNLDPFCVCEVVGRSEGAFHTKLANNTCNPRWLHVGLIQKFDLTESLHFSIYSRGHGPEPGTLLCDVILPGSVLAKDSFTGELPLNEARKQATSGRGPTISVEVRRVLADPAGELTPRPKGFDVDEITPMPKGHDMYADELEKTPRPLASSGTPTAASVLAAALIDDGDHSPSRRPHTSCLQNTDCSEQAQLNTDASFRNTSSPKMFFPPDFSSRDLDLSATPSSGHALKSPATLLAKGSPRQLDFSISPDKSAASPCWMASGVETRLEGSGGLLNMLRMAGMRGHGAIDALVNTAVARASKANMPLELAERAGLSGAALTRDEFLDLAKLVVGENSAQDTERDAVALLEELSPPGFPGPDGGDNGVPLEIFAVEIAPEIATSFAAQGAKLHRHLRRELANALALAQQQQPASLPEELCGSEPIDAMRFRRVVRELLMQSSSSLPEPVEVSALWCYLARGGSGRPGRRLLPEELLANLAAGETSQAPTLPLEVTALTNHSLADDSSAAIKVSHTLPDSAAAVEIGRESLEAVRERVLRGIDSHQPPLVVCVLGGREVKAETQEVIRAAARELRQALGEHAVFVTGGLPGAQKAFAEAFHDNGRLRNLLPLGESSGYEGLDVNAGKDLEERISYSNDLGDIYICFEGGPGLAKEANAVFARKGFVLPVARTGGASGGASGFPPAALAKPAEATDFEWAVLSDPGAGSAEAAGAALAAVVARHPKAVEAGVQPLKATLLGGGVKASELLASLAADPARGSHYAALGASLEGNAKVRLGKETYDQTGLLVRALQLDPRLAETYSDLGCVVGDEGVMLRGQRWTERQLYLKALELDPNLSIAMQNLSDILAPGEHVTLDGVSYDRESLQERAADPSSTRSPATVPPIVQPSGEVAAPADAGAGPFPVACVLAEPVESHASLETFPPRRSRVVGLPPVARASKKSKDDEITKIFKDINVNGSGVASLNELESYACDYLGFGLEETAKFFEDNSTPQTSGRGLAFEGLKAGYPWFNPFLIIGRKREVIVRKPGSLGGQMVNLDGLDDCDVYICDSTAQVMVDFCKRCRILLAPCESSVFVRDCQDCTFWIAAQQLRTNKAFNCTFHLFSKTEPVIEESLGLSFAPWAASFPRCSEQFSKAKFDPSRNLWNAIFDFTGKVGASNWSILPLQDLEELEVHLDDAVVAPPDGLPFSVTHEELCAPPKASSDEGCGTSAVNIPQTRPALPPAPPQGVVPRRRVFRDRASARSDSALEVHVAVVGERKPFELPQGLVGSGYSSEAIRERSRLREDEKLAGTLTETKVGLDERMKPLPSPSQSPLPSPSGASYISEVSASGTWMGLGIGHSDLLLSPAGANDPISAGSVTGLLLGSGGLLRSPCLSGDGAFQSGTSISDPKRELYLKYLENHPNSPTGYATLGDDLPVGDTISVNGTAYNRRELFLKVVELDPSHANAYAELATALQEDPTVASILLGNKRVGARELYVEALTLNPYLGKACRGLALLLTPGETVTIHAQKMCAMDLLRRAEEPGSNQSEWDSCKKDVYLRVLSLKKDDSLSYVDLASVMKPAEAVELGGQNLDARDLLFRALELDPSCARAYAALGEMLTPDEKVRVAGQQIGPKELFVKALELDGNLARANSGLAKLLAETGDPSVCIDGRELTASDLQAKSSNSPLRELTQLSRLSAEDFRGVRSLEQEFKASNPKQMSSSLGKPSPALNEPRPSARLNAPFRPVDRAKVALVDSSSDEEIAVNKKVSPLTRSKAAQMAGAHLMARAFASSSDEETPSVPKKAASKMTGSAPVNGPRARTEDSSSDEDQAVEALRRQVAAKGTAISGISQALASGVACAGGSSSTGLSNRAAGSKFRCDSSDSV